MIVNGKYFVAPPGDDSDFKELFARMVTAGAGRPVDGDGVPVGPWTPELLTDAISQIEANKAGVDLRTVQRWFQDNDQGLKAENVRWLACVFGCGDPKAINAWQAELGAARSRLATKRRQKRNTNKANTSSKAPSEPSETPASAEETLGTASRRWFSLARRTEAVFTGNSLNLPATVFAGAVALALSSYFFGIHNVTIAAPNGVTKQLGFHWAPNWTLLFMIFMPLFLANTAELITFWRNEGRPSLVPQDQRTDSAHAWARKIDASSYTFWAVFLICLLFAGVFQWISVRLLPLLRGEANNAPDWGSLAILRPDIISVPSTITFTGFSFLYMSICFYLFFASFVLLFSVFDDLRHIRKAPDHHRVGASVSGKLVHGVFRCTVLAILIAMCMKLQGEYLASNGENILSWIVGDAASVFGRNENSLSEPGYNARNHFNSLLIILVAAFVFLYGVSQIKVGSIRAGHLATMIVIVALLVVGYLRVAAFSGFSILLGAGVLAALYGLVHSGFANARAPGDDQNVL